MDGIIGSRRKNSALMAATLTRELIDENLMHKYGTSLDINMGREYQKYLDDKYRTLRKEFSKINKNEDEYISLEELTEFINAYSAETGKTFGDGYVQKLFNLMDKDHNLQLTIQEFIEAYIKLEERLRFKKITLTKLEEELRFAKVKYEKGMQENRDEKTNSQGMTDTATIYITLLDAKDLKPMDYNGASDPYVLILFGEKKAMSNYKPNTTNPAWNEDFSFPVTKMDSVLEIQVWNHAFGGDDLEGVVKIPLFELEDQRKVEKEYHLTLNGESVNNGTIRLRLHFLYSKYKYFSFNATKTEAQIERLQEDIIQLNKLFELFKKPFGILLYGEIDAILDKKILERSDDIDSYAASNRKSVYQFSRQEKPNRTLAIKVENVIKATLKTKTIKWSQLSLFMMYAIVACSCLSLIQRSDFVGLLLGVAIWIVFIKDKKIDVLGYIKYLLFTIFGNIFYDFFWLYLHYNTFWKNSSLELVESGLRKFSYLFSFLNFCFKIVLLVSLWIQFNKASIINKIDNKQQETKNNNLNNSNHSLGNTYIK